MEASSTTSWDKSVLLIGCESSDLFLCDGIEMSLNMEEENRLFSLPVRRHHCTPPCDFPFVSHMYMLLMLFNCSVFVLLCYIPFGYFITSCVCYRTGGPFCFCYLSTGLRNIYETRYLA